jgi:copper chaperone CopZ
MKKIYEVQGMTCGECSRHVKIEFLKLKGVIDVVVDLSEGTATITQEHPLDLKKVAYMLDDIGYTLGKTL